MKRSSNPLQKRSFNSKIIITGSAITGPIKSPNSGRLHFNDGVGFEHINSESASPETIKSPDTPRFKN